MSIEDIKARLAAASPGPWRWDKNKWLEGAYTYVAYPGGTTDQWLSGMRSLEVTDYDARLIAHAPEDIAYLVAEVERLRAEKEST